jgi:hypothetical protein
MSFKLVFEQSTKYPFHSQRHSSGHFVASVVGCIINNNHNTTAGAANSSNTNNTACFGGKAIFLDLHRERN